MSRALCALVKDGAKGALAMTRSVKRCPEPLRTVAAVRAHSEYALAEKYRALFNRYKKLLKRINTETSNSRTKARVKLFFDSYAVCYVALVHSANKHKLIFTPAELDELAKELAISKDFGEPIRVSTQSKKSGGFRITSKSGLKRRAVQFLINQAMARLDIGYTLDTSLSGNGGRDKFVSSVITACEERGLKFVVKFDISDCYGSIDHKAAWDILNLFPNDVIAFHALNHSRHYLYFNDIKSEDRKHATRMARRGIPQGSPSSSRLASAVIERLLEGVIATGTREVHIHGDDGAICTSSMSEAKAIKNALADRCKNHPFGPFRLKYCEIAYIPTGVSLLGYYVKSYPYYISDENVALKAEVNPRLIAVPCGESFKTFFKKLASNLKNCSDEEFVNETWQAGRKWLQAYKLWKCQPYLNSNGSIQYDYPALGVSNFITQLTQIIYEEDKRRGYTEELSWLYSFNKRCVLSRAGFQQSANIPSNNSHHVFLIAQNDPHSIFRI